MRKSGWKIFGLEPDEGARKIAREKYNIDPLVPTKIFELTAGSFDAITAWHVLEHVHQLHEYMDQLCKLVTGNGKIFIAVPNYTSQDAVHYDAAWAAYDVPRHLYHFSPKSMTTLVNMHGMKVESVKPMWFDSFYVSMLSEQYKKGKGNLIKAAFIGLASNINTVFNKKKCSSLIYVISRNC
jgi:2-polyprenyl-3-methyl-5-hydroxy-6-metoxy-1,4-benzoquinol methylase